MKDLEKSIVAACRKLIGGYKLKPDVGHRAGTYDSRSWGLDDDLDQDPVDLAAALKEIGSAHVVLDLYVFGHETKGEYDHEGTLLANLDAEIKDDCLVEVRRQDISDEW